MVSKVVGIYGASGFGVEVLPVVRSILPDTANVVFIDDNAESTRINGVAILAFDEFLNLDFLYKEVSVCIADSGVRQNLANRLKDSGIDQFSVRAPNAIVLDEVIIGKGSVICPFVTLTSNIKIGVGFHANIYSYVAHNCIIGDYVTFAPGVKCNGNVVIEDYAYIGTGAIIKQGSAIKPLTIGEGAVVGMGAVVTKSVKAGDVVTGNPARSIKRQKR